MLELHRVIEACSMRQTSFKHHELLDHIGRDHPDDKVFSAVHLRLDEAAQVQVARLAGSRQLDRVVKHNS